MLELHNLFHERVLLKIKRSLQLCIADNDKVQTLSANDCTMMEKIQDCVTNEAVLRPLSNNSAEKMHSFEEFSQMYNC
jgi:hypothetical protein